MNIEFKRDGDDVDILFSDINGPVTQYTVPLHALMGAIADELLSGVDTVEQLRVHSNRVATQRDEVRRQLAEANTHSAQLTRERDEALTQVGRLRDMLEEGSQDVVQAVRQRDSARELNVTLTRERDEAREKWDRVSRMSVELTSERDAARLEAEKVRAQFDRDWAIIEGQRAQEITAYNHLQRSVRALRRTIKELTS